MTDDRREKPEPPTIDDPLCRCTPPLMASAQLLTTPSVTTSSPVSGVSVTLPCCDGARPLVADPHTGQPVCSCRFTSSLLASAYSRVPVLPESMYSTAAAAAAAAAYATQSAYHSSAFSPSDPSTFYSPLNSAYSLKDSMDVWGRAGMPPTAPCYPYDMASYPYGYGGMDLNGARRKNATRESTSTLKAWLQEHIKNPYPTKGEKIMLAIITKMTLTQVSTWFANARRRLKKENKMTWSPKNRCDEEDDDDDDDIRDGSDGEERRSDTERRTSSDNGDDDHVDLTATGFEERLSPPTTTSHKVAHESDKIIKPKIWSLADTATSSTPPSGRSRSPSNIYGSNMWTSAALYQSGYNYAPHFSTASQRYAAGAVTPAAFVSPGLGAAVTPSAGLGLVGIQTTTVIGSGKMASDDARTIAPSSLGNVNHRLPASYNSGLSVSVADAHTGTMSHPAFPGTLAAAFRPVDKSTAPR